METAAAVSNKALVVVQGVRCKEKKNREIKGKSNSLHWAQRAQLLYRKFSEIFPFFCSGVLIIRWSSLNLTVVGIHKHIRLLLLFLKRSFKAEQPHREEGERIPKTTAQFFFFCYLEYSRTPAASNSSAETFWFLKVNSSYINHNVVMFHTEC